jgi:uncharacterized protein YbjT (DUF2867 family)
MSDARTVLVIGATGRVGRHVVSGLLEHGAQVNALVRRPETARLPGEVSVVPGETGRPDTVGAAAEGAEAAFLLWPSFSPAGASEAVSELARHVSRVVYLSAARLQRDDEGVIEGVWADVEQRIERSGVAWTFVRVGGFAANTLAWAPQIQAGDEISIPYPRAARSLVHERDIAEVAVRALMDPGLRSAAFAVTGPEVLTQLEQVRAIGDAIGRPLLVREQSPDVARREFAAIAGSDEYAARAVAHWASLVDEPERATDDVERVTGHPARSFAEWAREHVDDFARPSNDHVAER